MNIFDILFTIFINVISSIIFTVIFYYVLRPNIKISPFIVKNVKNGKELYQFKIINRSFFPANYVKMDLILRKPEAVGYEKFNIKYIKQDIDLPYITRLYPVNFNKNVALYAVVVSTESNLSELLKDPLNTLEFTIDSQHSISALSKIFVQNYSTYRVIKEGVFSFGNNLKVT